MENSALRRLSARCLMLLLLAFACFVSALAQQGRVSRAAAATMPAGALDMGPLPGSQNMAVTLHLAPSATQTAALMQFLTAVQTPGGAQYRQFLTPAVFGQQFGATAAQTAAVGAFAGSAGMSVSAVSPSGLRVTLTGTVSQMEAAFAPALHGVQIGTTSYFANTAAPTIPAELASQVLAVDGFDNLPAGYPVTIAGAGPTVTVDNQLAGLMSAVEANSARVLTLSSAACVEDFSAYTAAATQLVLRQAAAQGITVLAASGCGMRGSAGFPSALSEVTAVAIAPGSTPAIHPTLTELRPAWQNAPGLPSDVFRHEPDLTVSSLAALAQTMNQILLTEPVPADASAPRVGNINTALYDLAPTPQLFTQPDKAAAGTWEAGTGLGLVDLAILKKVFPNAALSDNVSINVSNPGAVHGQSITFSSTVTDTSGQGNGVVPTGTVTFTTNTGVNLGTETLSGGTASVTTNTLPGNNNYTVTASYSGDGTYNANTSVATGFSVTGEVSVLSATNSTATLGQTFTIMVTDKSGSGVGTPSGTVTVTPEGTSDTSTYTGTLSGSNGTATATVTVNAVQAGTDDFQINCTSPDPSFTCYTPISYNVTVAKGTSTTSLTVSPASPTQGQTTTFTATVAGAGAGYPTPTGNVNFSDGSTVLGSATLNNGTATFTTSNINGSTHSFTALYSGDNNYNSSTSSPTNTQGPVATTTTLSVSPNPPVNGSTTTLTANISPSTSNGASPTSTVTFYEDGAVLATVAVSGAQAVYTTTTISGKTAHNFYAVYAGDSNFATSTSNTVTTTASGGGATTTTLTVSPNPPVAGSPTTLNAVVSYPISGTLQPTGNVNFYEDGVLLATVAVSNGDAFYTSSSISGVASHNFYAVYVGDANFTTSTSNTVTTKGTGAGATTAVLTVNPNPPVNGSTTTLTATIGYTANGGTSPTGNVNFYEDGNVIGTSAVTNGVATYSTASITSNTTHSFYAIYVGDANFTTSTSNTVTTNASQASTTTMVTASATTIAAGSSVTFTATVTPATLINNTNPTGTVTFTASGQGTLCTSQLNGTTATCTATLTLAYAQTIVATYNGNTNYTMSTSSAVTVNVGPATAIALTVSPQYSVAYGTAVTITANLTTTTTGGITGPNGSVTFTLTGGPNGPITYTVLNNPQTQNSATDYLIIAAPPPGTYTITATCTGSNYSCTGVTSTAALVTVKGNTTTVLTVSPTAPTAGQQATFTATVASTVMQTAGAMGTVLAPSGTVTFYVNGTNAGSASVSGSVATFTTTLPSSITGGTVTAVYSGDNNYNSSNSNSLPLTGAPSATGVTLTVNRTTALAGSDIILTATVAAPSNTGSAPGGTVTFYDLYNGQQTALGSATLTSSGQYSGIAQLATTGLLAGTHNITAVFGATSSFTGSTSNDVIVNITDYSVTFSPPSLTLNEGASGSLIATITALNGFAGQVVLGCTPPSGSAITCSFSPAIVTGSGTSVLTVSTTAPQSNATPAHAALERAVTGVSLAALLLGFLLPGSRRRRPMLFMLIASAVLFGALGCTHLSNAGSGSPGLSGGGTPLGTQVLSITTSGSDGTSTNRHDVGVQVTVQ